MTWNSIALSDNLEIIHHKSEKPSRSNSRNRCSLTSQQSNARDIKSRKDDDEEGYVIKTKDSLQISLAKKMSVMERLKLNHKTTVFSSKLGEVDKYFPYSNVGDDENFPLVIDEERRVDFDPDFVLWRVFGYQNIYLKTEDGIFDIFEPTKIKDFDLGGYNEFAVNILHGYISESEDLENISSNSDAINKSDSEVVNDQRTDNKLMTPRSVIRKRTTNFLTPYKDANVLKEGITYKEKDFLIVETTRKHNHLRK